MRIQPDYKYALEPCSYVAMGCCLNELYNREVTELPSDMKKNGYVTLDVMNKYIRSQIPIKKKTEYKRGERPALKDFLVENRSPAIICVLGHYIFANNGDYYSFFNNDNDEVVAVWFVKYDNQTMKERER